MSEFLLLFSFLFMKFIISYHILIFIIFLFLFIFDMSAFLFLNTALSFYGMYIIRFKSDKILNDPLNYIWLLFTFLGWFIILLFILETIVLGIIDLVHKK